MAKVISYAQREAEALAQLAIEVCLDPASPPEHVAAARARLAADTRRISEVLADAGLSPWCAAELRDVIRRHVAVPPPADDSPGLLPSPRAPDAGDD